MSHFCEDMKNRTFAIVRLPPELTQTIRRAEAALLAFYQAPQPVKDAIKIESGRDVGYKYTENVKEFFQMRFTELAEFPWPAAPPGTLPPDHCSP